MIGYITLGPTPAGECCEQIGPNCNYDRMKKECRVYIHQLERMFPDAEKSNARFAVMSFPHDFGTYKEVVVKYDEMVEDSVNFAFHVESNLPEEWDDEALDELNK